MENFLYLLFRIALLFLAAFGAWRLFPREVLDLAYGDWLKVTTVAWIVVGLERLTDEIR